MDELLYNSCVERQTDEEIVAKLSSDGSNLIKIYLIRFVIQ